MKYSTARKAWHNAFFNGGNSSLIEILRLGCNVQKTHADNSTDVCIDQWLAGKIQNAIASLSEPLQNFGNYLYKPEFTDDEREQAQELVKIGLLTKYAGQIWTDDKLLKTHYLIFAVMEDYKSLVSNGNKRFKNKGKLVEFLNDWYGVKLIRNNFIRDWQDIYNTIMVVCDELDMKALRPVSMAVQEIIRLVA